VISVSRRDLDDLVERRFVPRDHGSHVPNAVDLEAFGNGCARSVRQALGIAPGRFVVGTVARLVPQKAVADLILAMVHVRDAVLVSVGDGPERARLQALAATHGVHVLFLGARADVPRLLPALDVFALSSRWEGEPLALLEALAAGLPCVATATEGAREVLEGHAAGWLTPVGDPRALGIALDALRRDAERRARMAAAARELVTQRTWENAARQVLEVYRAALAH
jgi:glycosyltransferase involved in cell wall biosynthesis